MPSVYFPALCVIMYCCVSSRRFVKTSRCPLVFIVSDSQSGDSSSRFLFPKEIQEELDISSIRFQAIHTAGCDRDVRPLWKPTLDPREPCYIQFKPCCGLMRKDCSCTFMARFTKKMVSCKCVLRFSFSLQLQSACIQCLIY